MVASGPLKADPPHESSAGERRSAVVAASESGGRRPTFSSVYADHVDRIYGFLGYRVRSRHEAEDLTQLVFEKALRAWHRFDPRIASPSTWLLAIAKNVLTDHLRRRRETLMGDEAVAAALDSSPARIEPHVPGGLAEAISTLSSREQTVIALRFGGDLTGSEIAGVLGLSTDNAHQILSRALKKLRASDALGDGERSRSGDAE